MQNSRCVPAVAGAQLWGVACTDRSTRCVRTDSVSETGIWGGSASAQCDRHMKGDQVDRARSGLTRVKGDR